MSVERWRPVVAVPGYEVSDLGRVRSLRRRKPRIMTPHHIVRPTCAYLIVELSLHPIARRRSYLVHRLVGEAFLGPQPHGMHTRHLDGDPTNNRLTNLAYGTPAENAADTKRHALERRVA